MSRWRAAGLHLAISLLVGLVIGAVVHGLWYPAPGFVALGGSRPALIQVGVYLLAGPMLTLIVFRAGKWGMAFDLWFIGICQALALAFAVHVLAHGRPVYLVYAVDRLVVVNANALDDADLAAAPAAFARRSWSGPVLVAALPPSDPAQANELLLSALAGKDVERLPRYYEAYATHAAKAIAHAKPLSELAARSAEDRAVVEAFIADHASARDAGYLPFVTRAGDWAVVIARDDGRILGYLRVDPW